jgi:hypothetical protein
MKRPLIWTVIKNEFYILWVWRIAFVYSNTFEDETKFGISKNKRSILAWYKNYAIGVGHSFGAEVEGYKSN